MQSIFDGLKKKCKNLWRGRINEDTCDHDQPNSQVDTRIRDVFSFQGSANTLQCKHLRYVAVTARPCTICRWGLGNRLLYSTVELIDCTSECCLYLGSGWQVGGECGEGSILCCFPPRWTPYDIHQIELKWMDNQMKYVKINYLPNFELPQLNFHTEDIAKKHKVWTSQIKR